MAKLYETIDELICGEEEAGKNPANYCFDEAWLIWLDDNFGLQNFAPKGYRSEYIALAEMLRTPEYSASTVGDYYIRIACAATEIAQRLVKCESEPSICRSNKRLREASNIKYREYAADGGPVQNSMYELLASKKDNTEDCQGCADRYALFSRDAMTNFYYVLKIAIALLMPELLCNRTFEQIVVSLPYYKLGPRDYRESLCLTKTYPAYLEAVENADKGISRALIDKMQREINRFSRYASTLGNYTCLINKLNDLNSLNKLKGTELHLNDGARINDQFALFCVWIDEYCEKRPKPKKAELDLIDAWKENMLFAGDIWNRYKDAALAYQAAFASRTHECRLALFTEYLRIVNHAIELRSEQIVKTIKGLKKGESAQTK